MQAESRAEPHPTECSRNRDGTGRCSASDPMGMKALGSDRYGLKARNCVL